MALFTLWRVLDHTLNEQERENISVRAIGACEWFPGVRWQRSFFVDEPGRLLSLCVYQGPTLEAVREQSIRCAVPFLEIREVTALTAQGHDGPGPLAAEPLFMVERQFPAETPLDAIAHALRSAADQQGVTWLRSYVDGERGSARCVLEAASSDAVRDHSQVHGLPCDSIESVGENHPAFWADIYDSFYLPRHWERSPATIPTER
ncbi:MAG: DUF4242 domain-containing protein [Dehalococcoidia bacterium]